MAKGNPATVTLATEILYSPLSHQDTLFMKLLCVNDILASSVTQTAWTSKILQTVNCTGEWASRAPGVPPEGDPPACHLLWAQCKRNCAKAAFFFCLPDVSYRLTVFPAEVGRASSAMQRSEDVNLCTPIL